MRYAYNKHTLSRQSILICAHLFSYLTTEKSPWTYTVEVRNQCSSCIKISQFNKNLLTTPIVLNLDFDFVSSN